MNDQLSVYKPNGNDVNNSWAKYSVLLTASFLTINIGADNVSASSTSTGINSFIGLLKYSDQSLKRRRKSLDYNQRVSSRLFDNTGDNQIADHSLASDHMNVLINKVASLSNLEDGWDGYGGSAPVKEAVWNTITFLNEIPLKYINYLSEERLTPTSYGTISVEWIGTEDDFFSVEVGAHEIAYFYEIGGEDGDSDGNIKINSNSYSERIVFILNKLFSTKLV